jgi:chromosome segregation ATPase
MSTATPEAIAPLPSLDAWMMMRARITDVLGEQSATTLLSVLPSLVDGGYASNERLGQMESRLRSELKTEISGVRTEIADLRGELKTEIAELRGELKAEIAELRGEMRTEFAAVRREMAELRGELKGEIAELRTELRTEIADLRGELKAEIAAGNAQTRSALRTMFFQQIGFLVSLAGIVLVVAKLL